MKRPTSIMMRIVLSLQEMLHTPDHRWSWICTFGRASAPVFSWKI